MKTDKERADEIEAGRRLRRMGYREKRCTNPNCVEHTVRFGKCLTCGGRGYTWESPIMR